jgi:C4-dicarboxylate-specific signal transduction histidine kinase
VDRAAEIINTLRSFGRKSDLIEERVDLNQPITAVLSMLRRQFELDNIRFELDLSDELPSVFAHSNRLQQVIFNLVANARDAINDSSSPNDVKSNRRIMIRTGSEDKVVYAEIEDTGIGIEEEDQQKIFEPFFTTKEAGQGMGLGLAISYGIVKDYGGIVRIRSKKNHGTMFRMEFPAASLRGGSKA